MDRVHVSRLDHVANLRPHLFFIWGRIELKYATLLVTGARRSATNARISGEMSGDGQTCIVFGLRSSRIAAGTGGGDRLDLDPTTVYHPCTPSR